MRPSGHGEIAEYTPRKRMSDAGKREAKNNLAETKETTNIGGICEAEEYKSLECR
jgi:hypothetical protein